MNLKMHFANLLFYSYIISNLYGKELIFNSKMLPLNSPKTFSDPKKMTDLAKSRAIVKILSPKTKNQFAAARKDQAARKVFQDPIGSISSMGKGFIGKGMKAIIK